MQRTALVMPCASYKVPKNVAAFGSCDMFSSTHHVVKSSAPEVFEDLDPLALCGVATWRRVSDLRVSTKQCDVNSILKMKHMNYLSFMTFYVICFFINQRVSDFQILRLSWQKLLWSRSWMWQHPSSEQPHRTRPYHLACWKIGYPNSNGFWSFMIIIPSQIVIWRAYRILHIFRQHHFWYLFWQRQQSYLLKNQASMNDFEVNT